MHAYCLDQISNPREIFGQLDHNLDIYAPHSPGTFPVREFHFDSSLDFAIFLSLPLLHICPNFRWFSSSLGWPAQPLQPHIPTFSLIWQVSNSYKCDTRLYQDNAEFRICDNMPSIFAEWPDYTTMPLQASWGYVVIGPSALLYSTDATYRLQWIFLNLPTNIVAIGIKNAILRHCLLHPFFLHLMAIIIMMLYQGRMGAASSWLGCQSYQFRINGDNLCA